MCTENYNTSLSTGVPPAQPILSPQITLQPQLSSQISESRQCQQKQQSFASNQTTPRLPDATYGLENLPNDLSSNAEKQIIPDRTTTSEQLSKRPTRYNSQIIQTTLKSPNKSPGKSPRQMEIVRQKSESARGRSRGARNSSVGRGSGSNSATVVRIPVSSRSRGRGRAPLVVPLGK